MCFSGGFSDSWCDYFPGPLPDQEKNQRPQSSDGEGPAQPGESGETTREDTEEGARAAAEGCMQRNLHGVKRARPPVVVL